MAVEADEQELLQPASAAGTSAQARQSVAINSKAYRDILTLTSCARIWPVMSLVGLAMLDGLLVSAAGKSASQFYQIFVDQDAARFRFALAETTMLYGGVCLTITVSYLVGQMLIIRWRRRLTTALHTHYFHKDTFFRIGTPEAHALPTTQPVASLDCLNAQCGLPPTPASQPDPQTPALAHCVARGSARARQSRSEDDRGRSAILHLAGEALSKERKVAFQLCSVLLYNRSGLWLSHAALLCPGLLRDLCGAPQTRHRRDRGSSVLAGARRGQLSQWPHTSA